MHPLSFLPTNLLFFFFCYCTCTGHSYAASVLTEYYNVGGITYPFTSTKCSVWDCAPIADDYCFEFSLNPQQDKWACSDVCGVNAAVAPTPGNNPTSTGSTTTATTTNTAVNGNGNGNDMMGVYSASCDAQLNAIEVCGQDWSEAKVRECLECYSTRVDSAITCSDVENTCKVLPERCECGDCDASILAWMECEYRQICPGLSCSAASSGGGSGSDDDNKAALIGGIVGGILGFGVIVCMVIAVVFIWMRRQRKSNAGATTTNTNANVKTPGAPMVKAAEDHTHTESNNSDADPKVVPTVQGQGSAVANNNKISCSDDKAAEYENEC